MLATWQAVEQNPPHSIQAEQCLLGSIILNQDALSAVDGIVTCDDFYEPIHRELFRCLVERHDAGERINVGLVRVTLSQLLAIDLAGLSVDEYVTRLATVGTTVISAADYARVIREMADKRRILDLAQTLKNVAARDQSATTVAIDAIEALDGIVSSRPDAVASRVSIGDASAASVERMTLAMQNPGRITGVTWGLHDLDALTGGVQRGELVVRPPPRIHFMDMTRSGSWFTEAATTRAEQNIQGVL